MERFTGILHEIHQFLHLNQDHERIKQARQITVRQRHKDCPAFCHHRWLGRPRHRLRVGCGTGFVDADRNINYLECGQQFPLEILLVVLQWVRWIAENIFSWTFAAGSGHYDKKTSGKRKNHGKLLPQASVDARDAGHDA
ncbi:MAG: hypothetical protein OXE85_01685, partial [Roseovarius sp.]|nr:hypothetical protein [Roseovarius sp.]